MIDLDRANLEQLLPNAATAPDWDDVMRRFGAQRSRRRRRFAALAAAALVAVVGTASAVGTVREFFLDRGFIGLPPLGATPSDPASGDLVLHFSGRSARLGGELYRVWVYADGRMIWDREGGGPHGANDLTTGLLERRLTPEGVDLLRSTVIATGLFDRDLSLLMPWLYPSVWGAMEVHDGDRVVRLRWKEPRIDPEPDVGTNATPDQLTAFEHVDELLSDPASNLPADAWTQRAIQAYVPARYAVCYEGRPQPLEAERILALLPPPVAMALRAKSRRRFDAGPGSDPPGHFAYCSEATTEEARALAEALSGLEVDDLSPYRLGYRVAVPGQSGAAAFIWFEPYLPHGEFLMYSAGR